MEGTYTYRMPADSTDTPSIGMRVLAPLGPKKIVTGIVATVRQSNDQDQPDRLKEIYCYLDEYPLVTQEQLLLWQRMADYYMCTLGEVMRAALPTALKLESETRVHKNPDFIAENRLPKMAEAVLDMLPENKSLSLQELAKQLDVRSVLPAVNALLEVGAVFVEESIREKYVPKTKAFISLGEMPALDGSVRLTEKQLQLNRSFLSVEAEKVGLNELLASAGVSSAVLSGLLQRGILVKTLEQVSALEEADVSVLQAHLLTPEQQQAVNAIRRAWQQTPTVLLHGVTSSGKTEVYIHLIQEQISQGKQVLYLVPEIALTTQLTDRLQAVFGNRLGVYHSRFSDRERVEIYKHVLAGNQYDVVIGVRSSLFLPFKNLGLIIVDEEHDASYKQQDPNPRYHARTTALMLSSLFGAKTLLGTATPAVETYYNALNGKYGLVEMTQRFAGLSLPAIHLLDLKKAYHRKEMDGHFSTALSFRIREQLAAGKQVLLFQNHRGYNAYVECGECSYVPKCVHCDISLTEHRSVVPGQPSRLVCHYCGYSIPTPVVCPECGQGELKDRGFGTEKLEEEAKEFFPEARVARMDADSTQTKHAHEKLIRKFAAHEIDILVGTQMITKGLDFKDVSLVAVMKADSILNIPDFRAYERGYQMLEQVSGRAGRHGEAGHVIMQTADVDNPLFLQLKKHDYRAMYEEQLAQRKEYQYPPFHRIISVSLRHREPSRLDTAARTLHDRLRSVFGSRCSDVIIPAVSRVQSVYVRVLILKIEASAPYAKAKEMLAAEIRYVQSLPPCKGAQIVPDVDPM